MWHFNILTPFNSNPFHSIDTCNPNPCQNNGFCSVTGQLTYTCSCITGYVGVHCEIQAGTTFMSYLSLRQFDVLNINFVDLFRKAIKKKKLDLNNFQEIKSRGMSRLYCFSHRNGVPIVNKKCLWNIVTLNVTMKYCHISKAMHKGIYWNCLRLIFSKVFAIVLAMTLWSQLKGMEAIYCGDSVD